MPALNVLLPTVAAGFYLIDSAMFLCANELVFTGTREGWRFADGSSWLLLGRRPFLPNPLAPHVPLYRVAWNDNLPTGQGTIPDNTNHLHKALRPVGYMVSYLLLLLLSLPIVLYWSGTGVALLAVFALAYLGVLVTVMVIYSKRIELGLSGKTLFLLGIEAFACPPLAINLVRKISLQHGLGSDAIGFARSAFSAPEFEALITLICERVDEDLNQTDEQAPRHATLLAYKNQLMSLLACQPQR